MAVVHSGGGWIVGSGVGPGSGRPLPSSRLIARTIMSWSQTIWHDSRTPVTPARLQHVLSATVIVAGSPSMNSTRHVVHRALPPHAWSWSIVRILFDRQDEAFARLDVHGA